METLKKAKVISFINMKGGVGKTTLTVNLADQLSRLNKKVLVIDMDPQFNSTQTLLLASQKYNSTNNPQENKIGEDDIQVEVNSSNVYQQLVEEHKTVYSLFVSPTLNEEHDHYIYNVTKNLDLLAGNLNLSDEISGDTVNKGSVLISFIETNELKSKYDFILIDCPPTWSILTYASLFASDGYVIPSKVDFYSSLGIKMLEEKIEKHLLNDWNFQQRPNSENFQNYGVIFTLVHKNIIAEQNRINRLTSILNEDSIPIFHTNIPHYPSVPSNFNLYSDFSGNNNYRDLNHAIGRFVTELLEKFSETN